MIKVISRINSINRSDSKIYFGADNELSSNSSLIRNENSKGLKPIVPLSLLGLGIVGVSTVLLLRKGKLSSIPKGVKQPPKGLVQPQIVDDLKKLPVYSEELVSLEKPISNSDYAFLMRNPVGFYLENGIQMNNFLRKGELSNINQIDENMSEVLIEYLQSKNQSIKGYNRAIVDSIEKLDSCIDSVLDAPMTVWRDAPISWIKQAKEGIVVDKAFCSTSTVPGASMEGLISKEPSTRYEIRLPKGTSYLDLTYTAEKEILLPRGSKFKVIGDNVLELVL